MPTFLPDFLKFAAIGTLGFVWDALTTTAAAPYCGPYVAGLVGFLVAVTSNWWLNRIWTYGHLDHGALHRQWLAFVSANLAGFCLNRGCYALLVTFVPTFRAHLVLAVAAGAGAGLFANFSLTRKFVFRS